MFRFAVRNLLSRKTRSTLSLLGLTVAILGMVGLFSVAEGLDRMVADTFRRIPGLVAMQPGAPIPLFSRLPAAWRDEIAAVPGVRIVNSEIWERVNVIDGEMMISPPRFFFGTDLRSRLALEVDVYRQDLVAGRYLTLADRGTLNCVVSRPIADQFHKQVGETLNAGGHELTIVGLYECGSLLLDVAIILDIDEVRRMTRFDADSVSSFYIEPHPGVDGDELAARIQEVFRGREPGRWRPVLPGLGGLIGEGASPPNAAETPPIEVRSANDWAQRFDQFAADLDLFLIVLTSIGVTVAVLSIVNTMVMSVHERMIEFGILKANGWSKLDVLKLVTGESALLGLGGGVLGSLLGWAATLAINARWPTRIHLYASPGLLVFSVAFATVLGVLGGLYPAVSAMRMMPMDAIRRG
ncbi:MAG TPA: ABC transporter permease [Planctomycetaceae bacterium]|nr:ABC transporter permease [Planctomycetaceae bacterium]